MNPQQPTQQPSNFQQASSSAIQQINQPQDQSQNIDPKITNTVIDKLKTQSQQFELQQKQAEANNDIQGQQALKLQQELTSKALGQLNDTSTQGKIGQANATGNYSYSGECLKWVDDQQGNTNRKPTAIADYQANLSNNNIKTSGIPPKGARVYFSSPTIPAGHVGISDGKGGFTSATDNGIQTFKINQWQNYAGQSYLGYSIAKK